MKTWVKILIILIILGSIGTGIGYYEFTRTSKGAGDRSADAAVSAADFIKEFKANAGAADKKYNNQDIQLSGKAGTVEKGGEGNISVQLHEGDDVIECSFGGAEAPAAAALKPGDKVTLKGLYTGYDDMMGIQIKLNKCVLVK